MRNPTPRADTWTVDDLAKDLNVDSALIRKGLDTWIGHGAIHEAEKNTFILLEEAGAAPIAPVRASSSRHGKCPVLARLFDVLDEACFQVLSRSRNRSYPLLNNRKPS